MKSAGILMAFSGQALAATFINHDPDLKYNGRFASLDTVAEDPHFADREVTKTEGSRCGKIGT